MLCSQLKGHRLLANLLNEGVHSGQCRHKIVRDTRVRSPREATQGGHEDVPAREHDAGLDDLHRVLQVYTDDLEATRLEPALDCLRVMYASSRA